MGRFGQNGVPLPRSTLDSSRSRQDRSGLDDLVVAAVDESYSSKRRNLTYLTVVCSLPDRERRETLPKAETALKDPTTHGLIIVNMMLPPWQTGYERATFWIRGVWYGLKFANKELNNQGQQPIGIAFIDGDDPGGFRVFEGLNTGIDVLFASKNGTRRYEAGTNPVGVKLLTLADGVVRLVRQKVDEKGNLDSITSQLAEQQFMYVTFAPALPGHNGTGLVHMQGQ